MVWYLVKNTQIRSFRKLGYYLVQIIWKNYLILHKIEQYYRNLKLSFIRNE